MSQLSENGQRISLDLFALRRKNALQLSQVTTEKLYEYALSPQTLQIFVAARFSVDFVVESASALFGSEDEKVRLRVMAEKSSFGSPRLCLS